MNDIQRDAWKARVRRVPVGIAMVIVSLLCVVPSLAEEPRDINAEWRAFTARTNAAVFAELDAHARTSVRATALSTESPRRLVSANGLGYVTAFSLTNTTDYTVDVTLVDCNFRGKKAHLVPHGAVIVSDADGEFCSGPFTLLFPLPDGVRAHSLISFRNGSDRSSFNLTPVGAVAYDRPSVVGTHDDGAMVSDAVDGTWITTFATQKTPMSIEIYNPQSPFLPILEVFTASPPVSQYRVKAQVGAFFGRVMFGAGGFGCLPARCSDLPPVYGFASSGTQDGGSVRDDPFGSADEN